jgi:hypothetical protein
MQLALPCCFQAYAGPRLAASPVRSPVSCPFETGKPSQ